MCASIQHGQAVHVIIHVQPAFTCIKVYSDYHYVRSKTITTNPRPYVVMSITMLQCRETKSTTLRRHILHEVVHVHVHEVKVQSRHPSTAPTHLPRSREGARGVKGAQAGARDAVIITGPLGEQLPARLFVPAPLSSSSSRGRCSYCGGRLLATAYALPGVRGRLGWRSKGRGREVRALRLMC